MTDKPPSRRAKALPILLAAGAAIVAANAAAWLWFRARQDEAGAQTRDRLRPRP